MKLIFKKKQKAKAMEKQVAENIIRNYFYREIRIEHCLKRVYWVAQGNSIPIFVDGEICNIDLEEWTISVDFDYESATLDSLQDLCRDLAQKATEYEREQLGNRNAHHCTCHTLGEWRFLENAVGGIINNGKVTLVKYAKILEDME